MKFSTVLRWRCRPGPLHGSHSAMLTIRPRGPLTGAAALIIGWRHHRIDFARRDLLHRAGRNAVGGEILLLVGLQLVEAGDAFRHSLGTERFRCHGGSSTV